jgi:membrane-bound metal-dependent hydrolase YbcI (DUF457 family)
VGILESCLAKVNGNIVHSINQHIYKQRVTKSFTFASSSASSQNLPSYGLLMPSPVAHALGGVAVAWLADLIPGRTRGRPETSAGDLRVVIACAGLAAVPDADLLLPIAHRTMSHSFVAVAAVGLFMIIAAAVTGKVTARIAITCTAAYASHLLLDWLQHDPTAPHGVQLLWPFSSTWFVSGWQVFPPVDRRHFFEWQTMKQNAVAMVQELVILAPPLAGLWLVRVKTAARFAAEMSRGDHPSQ